MRLQAIQPGIINPPIKGKNPLIRGSNPEIPEHDDCNCKPAPPLQIDQPGNPMSWIEGATKTQSGAFSWIACIFSCLSEGVLGNPSIDPVMQRGELFKGIELNDMMYDIFRYAKLMQEENKKANKDQFKLALAA